MIAQTLLARPRSNAHALVPAERRGVALVFTIITMGTLMALASFAVDYAHVQLVKSEMQRQADAAALAYLQTYNTRTSAGYSTTTAETYGNSAAALMQLSACNPVDQNSGTAPTVATTPGSWNSSTKTFYPNATPSGSNVMAVQVTISRRTANGNAVPLFWGKLVGSSWCDVHASSTAALLDATSGNVTVPVTANPYLAGMPAGTTTIWGDTASANGGYQVTSIPVTPGTYITLTNTSGTSSIVPGYVPYTGADGDTSLPLHHGQNYDSNPDPAGPNPENNIADAIMPADAVVGVFLNNSAPTSNSTPTGANAEVDWTKSSQANQTVYSNIVLQQPFKIGNGANSSGVVQQFLVPPGATRLFLGVWDGVCYNNNGGGPITGKISVKPKAEIVQTD